MQTLVKFIKARNAHVTGRPVDFQSSRSLGEELPCPEVVPGIMHTYQKVGKKVLKLLQKEAFGTAEGTSNKESCLAYVDRQIAVAHTEKLVKDEEKAGDNISMAMNCESIRLIFNRWREMFGDLLSRKWALIAELLSSVYSIVYSSSPPTVSSAVFLWIASNLTWNLTRILDQLASLREKKHRKPVVQSNHFHCFAAELPRVYEATLSVLCRLGALFHMLTEEAGEAYQKVAKTEGYNHSDRKTNVVDTMYRGEQMRDWAIMAYGTGAQDFSAIVKANKRFAATIVPNLSISACMYSSNSVFRSTFLSLAASMATKEIAQHALFVYTPAPQDSYCDLEPSASGAGLFSRNKDRLRTCACTCFCKCLDCRKHCRCSCPPDCLCIARASKCRCQRLPAVLVVANSGPQEQLAFLSVSWCNAQLPDHISAAANRQAQVPDSQCEQHGGASEGERVDTPASGDSLLPCSQYMRQQARSLLQASAKAFLLRRHLLTAARLRLRVFAESKTSFLLWRHAFGSLRLMLPSVFELDVPH